MIPRGLTLIEMLISLFIFSLIALGSYRVLTASLALDERFQYQVAEGLSNGAAMQQLREDLEQIRYRQLSDNLYPQVDPESGLRFVRSAQAVHDGRVEQQVLALQYRLQEVDGETAIVRAAWRQAAFDGEPAHRVAVFSKVRQLVFEVIDDGKRYRRWPPAARSEEGGQDAARRPEALSISWLTETGDEHQMFVALP